MIMEVVMGMVMIMEGVKDHLPQGELMEMAEMEVMMEMVVEEMIHHPIRSRATTTPSKL